MQFGEEPPWHNVEGRSHMSPNHKPPWRQPRGKPYVNIPQTLSPGGSI